MCKKILNYFFVLVIALCFNFSSIAQTSLVLQPGSEGKDAKVNSVGNGTGGNAKEFEGDAWTWSGSPGATRSMIEFDLSKVPCGATIISAKLSLYGFPGSRTHSELSGSNESVLQRITSPWNESTVNWAGQPSVTTVNEVTLASTSVPAKNYLDIDVTTLIKEMLIPANGNHGFMIRLKNENYYRRMCFASSDYADANLHPKLVICYEFPDTLHQISGHIYFGDSILTKGLVSLFDASKDSNELPFAVTNITSDSFYFNKIPKGDYVILATPTDYHSTSYFPTYYVNSRYWKNAYQLNVESNVFSLDIQLVQKNNNSINEIANYHIYAFPNPAKSSLTIKYPPEKIRTGTISIIDLTGKLVFSSKINIDSDGITKIDINQLSKGIYILRITGDNGLVYYTKIAKD